MESSSQRAELLLGFAVFAALGAFIWLSFALGSGAPRDAKHYVLLFDSALGLSLDNAVAVAGVKVGVVDDIRVEGRKARVSVAIERSVPMHDDARAAVRQKTLLGEKYVDIDPGSAPSPELADGATITENIPTVEIDQVVRDVAALVTRLNTITPPLESAIARIDAMLEGENGEKFQGDLSATLGDLRVLIRETGNFVKNSGGDAAVVLAALRERGPQLLTRLESASQRVDGILAGVDPQIIKNAVDKVGPAATDVAHVTEDMRAAMSELRSSARRLDTVLARVDKTLVRLDSVNEQSVREFLQIQGVRVNLIPDATVQNRIKKLREEAVPLPE